MNTSEQAMGATVAEKAERKENNAGFENPRALAEAYKSLQAEFTRKSQKLKETERELDALRQEADEPPKPNAEAEPESKESEFESFLRQFPEADANAVVRGTVCSGDFAKGGLTREYVRMLKAELDALRAEAASEEEIAKKAIASEVATEAVVREYLKGVKATANALPPSVFGTAPVSPPARPKTIKEAGRLAGDYFKI